jgi:hypothetical protein
MNVIQLANPEWEYERIIWIPWHDYIEGHYESYEVKPERLYDGRFRIGGFRTVRKGVSPTVWVGLLVNQYVDGGYCDTGECSLTLNSGNICSEVGFIPPRGIEYCYWTPAV